MNICHKAVSHVSPKKLIALAMLLLSAGIALYFCECKKEPKIIFDGVGHIEHLNPSELNMIIHLKESNYEIGVSSFPSPLRKGEEWIFKGILDGGRIIYVKDVKMRVE